MNSSLFPVFRGTLQIRRQKIFSKGLYVCAGGLDICLWFQFRGLEVLFGVD